jgi:hypothetical protein
MDRFNGQPIIDSFAHAAPPRGDERDPSTPMTLSSANLCFYEYV